MQLSKSQKRNLRRKANRERNHVPVECATPVCRDCNKQFAELPIKVFRKRYNIWPHQDQLVRLSKQDGFECPGCKGEGGKLKRERKLAKWNKCVEMWKNDILFYYRPEQQTRVTLHNVRFMLDGEIASASFHGRVIGLEFEDDMDEDKFDTTFLICLTPRKDLHFNSVVPIISKKTPGVLYIEDVDGKFCVTVVCKRKESNDYRDMQRGSRCKDHCRKPCKKHKLGKIKTINF